MRISWFSQSAEVQANFRGDLRKLKERHIDRDVKQMSISGDITVTPGFTMLLVQGLTEANESGIVALELTPANDEDEVLLDEDQAYDSHQNYLSYNWMDYNCGIAKNGRFPKLDGGYIVTIPAGSGNIPDFLGRIDGLCQNQSRPLLFLLLLNRE
ncbi:hypothetical protein V496_00071 [Pseudogymnoascus sp. VKM F-4515 (FW-2607)]|nr:hypothetical protein V496_00071 [Pseudogymnoascus sp. VKM F-4515 (FW-2607)]